jgi:hypothetical protein
MPANILLTLFAIHLLLITVIITLPRYGGALPKIIDEPSGAPQSFTNTPAHEHYAYCKNLYLGIWTLRILCALLFIPLDRRGNMLKEMRIYCIQHMNSLLQILEDYILYISQVKLENLLIHLGYGQSADLRNGKIVLLRTFCLMIEVDFAVQLEVCVEVSHFTDIFRGTEWCVSL